jgi:hypothetical protein
VLVFTAGFKAVDGVQHATDLEFIKAEIVQTKQLKQRGLSSLLIVALNSRVQIDFS